jgi:sialate O-acetylesterase
MRPLARFIRPAGPVGWRFACHGFTALSFLVAPAGALGATISSKTNGPWISAGTWNGSNVPVAADVAQVNHAVSLAQPAAAQQLQVGTVGTNGFFTISPGGVLQTATNASIGLGSKAGRLLVQSNGVWSNGGRVQLCAGANSSGALSLDGGQYYSPREILMGGGTSTNSTATITVSNGGRMVLGSYLRFTSATNSTNLVTITADSSLDCTQLWFDNSAPGSVRSVTVNGGTLRFTGGASLTTNTTGGALISGDVTNSLNGTSTKVFFEGGQIVFREVDSLAEAETFPAVWNQWVDSGRIDSGVFSKAQLKQFLAWDGRTAVVNGFATEAAAVRPANIFASGCVLQRDQTNRVWGTGTPGDIVTVAIKSQSASATVGADNKWVVTLAPESAGGPFTMTMSVPGKRTVTLTDVYYGDVWILTGQSNMFQPLGAQVAAFPNDYPDVPDAADDLDDMRFMVVATFHPTALAADIIPKQPWTRWQADRLSDMSTVGYFFARHLRQQLHAHGVTNLPLGFIKSCRGGSGIEEWMDAASLDAVKPALAHPEFLGANATLGYNGMLAPIQDYAIKGALWYQGEGSGAYDARQSPDYPPLVNALLSSWREQWRNPAMPLYLVQLAPYLRYAKTPSDETWPRMREQQAACLAIPGTRMAVAIDGGLQWQIHPPFKDRVGERLARIALSETYGIPAIWRGPTLQNVHINGAEVTLTFSNVAAGLQTRAVDSEPDATEVTRTNAATGDTNFPPVSISADRLGGFALAGADGVFRWATEARIVSSNQVRLANRADVPAPVHVRYAFQNYPRCNLFNSEGLPAEPFRTDIFAYGSAGGSNSTPVNSGLINRRVSPSQATLQVSLAAIFDDVEDGEEPLTLSLTENSNSQVVTATLSNRVLNLALPGPAGTSTLSVRATDSGGRTTSASFELTVAPTYLDWRQQYFSAAELASAAVEPILWGDQADPDQDGLANLLEYALALSPRQANAWPNAQEIVQENGVLKVRYRRAKTLDPSVAVTLEKRAALDAGNWTPETLPESVVTEDADTEWREVSVVPAGPSLFYRVAIRRQ